MTNSPHRQPLSVRSFIAGMHEGYAVTQHGGRQHGVEVLLGPLAARRLLGVPMDEQRRTRRRPTTLPRPLQLRSTPHRTQGQAPASRVPTGVTTSRHRTTSRRTVGRLLAALGDAPTLRETTFGGGRGLLSFRVDDDAEMIDVFAITWIG